MSLHVVKNPITFEQNVTVNGNIIVDGNVDGRDVAADGSAQDTHIADLTLHRTINDSGTAVTDLWSGSKINTELSGKAATSHTHVAADITDFSSAADARITAQKGAANGLATLDGSSKIPSSQIPAIAITNVDVVANIAARDALTPGEGDVAKVTDSDGSGNPQTYIWDGSAWVDIQETSDVISVNGNTGTVTLTTTDIAEGTNEYYTEARVTANVSVAANTAHAANTSNPHSVTATQLGLGNVANIFSKYDATAGPTANDDASDTSGNGTFAVGSFWVDVTNDKAYVCVDATATSAVWTEVTSLASSADLSFIAGATYSTIQQMHDVFNSAGWLSGGSITDAGGGSIDVAAGQGSVRDNNTSVDTIFFFDWAASNGNAIPSGATRYVGVEYNGGSPQISIRSAENWNYNTDFPLGIVINESGTLCIANEPHSVGDQPSLGIQQSVARSKYIKDTGVGGIVLSETGTRNVAISAGTVWSKYRSAAFSAIDTSSSGSFSRYYRDGASGWTKVATQTQWDNANYDDDSGTLATITASYYAVQWVYASTSCGVSLLYGQGEYTTLGAATAELPPATSPDVVSKTSFLVGRIIFVQGASSATLVETFPELNYVPLASSGTNSNHNNLSSLQGGTTGEYYHFTNTQHTNILAHIADDTLHRVINDAGTSATELWSASKISTELSGKAATSHTHVAADVTDFNTAADARITAQKGAANGLATLDGSSKIPTSQLPALAITDVTVVADIAARDALTPNEGDVCKVNDSDGSGRPQTYIYDGSAWVDIQETSDVISVNGNTGVVTLTTTDINEGTNEYYTEARVNANTNVSQNTTHRSQTDNPHSVTAAQVGLGNVSNVLSKLDATAAPTANDDASDTSGNGVFAVGSVWVDVTNDNSYVCLDATATAAIWERTNVSAHGDLTDIGTNTHAQIDSHIASTSNPHSVTKSQVGLSEVQNTKVNFAASVAPAATDDSGSGYSVGSIWIDTTADRTYVCVDATATSAVWYRVDITAHADLSGVGTNTHAQIDSHIANTSNPHSVTATQVGLGEVQNLKVNLVAVVAPIETDDSGSGYAVGSRWINTATQVEYVCTDATVGQAIWRQTVDDNDKIVGFFDDFIGADISLDWLSATTGLTSSTEQFDAIGGQIKLSSGANASDDAEISLYAKTVDKSTNTCLRARIKIAHTTQTQVEFGSIIDSDNLVRFIYDVTTSAGNWFAETRASATSTSTDTTVSADTSWHTFEIKYTNTAIKFFVDNVLYATNTTNLASGLMNVYIKQTSKTTLARETVVDFVKMTGNREA